MSDAEHRLDGHRGVAQPAETVVPVAHFAHGFGQAGGQRRQHCAVVVGEQFQHQHAPFDDFVVAGVLPGPVGPVEPVDQRAAIFDLFAFDVDRDDLLVVRQQQEFVLFEPDLLAAGDGLQRNRRVEILAVLVVGGAVTLDESGGPANAHFALRIVRGRVVANAEAGPPLHETDVAVELRRQVVLLFERAVAGHVVEHLEFAFVRREARREDVGVRDVALPDSIAVGYVESERSAFRAVEQGGEHRGRIEVGEAKPFDAAPFGDERGGPAIADDAVIEIIFHHRFSCWSAGSSRLSRRSGPLVRTCRGPIRRCGCFGRTS